MNLADHDGWTPLHYACNAEHHYGKNVIPLLLAAGADVNAKSTFELKCVSVKGETPLSTSIDWFRCCGGGESIDADSTKAGLEYVSLLLRHGASLDDCWAGAPAETLLRHIEDREAPPAEIWSGEGYFEADIPVLSENEDFLACKKLIADERCRILKAKRKEILRLRSLVVRGRAKKSSDAMLEPSFRLPDGVLWNVLSFWPPRRPKTFSRASTYAGPRPGWVFTTREGRTGYWVDVQLAPAPWAEPPAGSLIARRRAAVRAAEAEAGTEVTIGPENLDGLIAFADRTGLSAIADPEARREAAAQKANEITALLNV